MSKQKTPGLGSRADQKNMIGDHLNFAASEAYKLLRTNLMFSMPDENKCRIVGVTSSIRGEGKSTTAINLAYMLAETGKNVLLIDCDMRLPVIAKRLYCPNSPGLSNLLAGLSNSVVQKTTLHEHLSVVTSGSIPPNPSELLGSERMKAAVDTLSEHFHFIILDLPPVSAVTDALVISEIINGMILVVRQNYSNKQALSASIQQLQYAGIKILGFVMTDAKMNDKKYYSKKYYAKGDYYGYGEKETATSANRSNSSNKKEKEKIER